MTGPIHYLPVGLGRQHLIQPLVSGAFPMGDIVLLVPSDRSVPTEMVDRMKESLHDGAAQSVQVREVKTGDFATMVATGYDDLLRDLAANKEIYVNAASSRWNLGTGYATAASYLLSEAPYRDWDRRLPSNPRDQICLYYTEPETYQVEEAIEIAGIAIDLKTELEEIRETAGDLREEVATDKQTAENIVGRLEALDDNSESIDTVFASVGDILDDSDEGSIAEAVHDIVEGIETITDGINTLAREENQESLELLKNVGAGGPMENIVSGLEDLSERPDTHGGRINSVDLFEYIRDRLERVHGVLKLVEERSSVVQREFDQTDTDPITLVEEFERRGIASGVREFGDQFYIELPQPMEFDLRPYQRAIIYTLATEGSVDSLKELIAKVAGHAITVADQLGRDVPPHEEVTALEACTLDPNAAIVEDYIVSKVGSGIQNNVTDLEDAGVVRKGKVGRTKAVELSQAGKVYAQTQTFDHAWRQAAFEQLCENVLIAVEEYVERRND